MIEIPLKPTEEMLETIRHLHWKLAACQLCRSDYEAFYQAMVEAAKEHNAGMV